MEYNINFTYKDNKQLKEIYKELLKRNGMTMTEANDELIVELPENDSFKFYENSFGDLMVETAWGHCYGINDVLQGKENPCFYALDRDAKGHRVNLNIVEE